MSYSPSTADETEFDGLPVLLPDQGGVLIGRVDLGEPHGVLAAYYIHWRGHMVLGVYEDGELMSVTTFEHESQIMADQVRALTTLEAESELSTIGKTLLKAWHVADLTPLGAKEAHVYALRELGEFARQLTANVLNVSPSTVDTQRQAAQRKRREAQRFLGLEQSETGEQETGTSDHSTVLINVITEIDDPPRAQ